MQDAIPDLGRAPLIPVLRPAITAGAPHDIHSILIRVAALRAAPDQFAVLLGDLNLAVEAADHAVVRFRVLDAVGETARLTEQHRELDEQEQVELNRRLAFLASKLDEQPDVTIEYFVPNEYKAGGAYVKIIGRVAKISAAEQLISMQDGQSIIITNVAAVDGKIFAEV